MSDFDLIVIGSGPGGYVASLHAAQLGMKVACVEKGKTLGGVCLNVGCIPSKSLLHSTEYYARINLHGSEHGVEVDGIRMNFQKLMERKARVVSGLVKGIEFLFKKNKVEWIQGSAVLSSPTSVLVDGKTFTAKNILLATGAEPIPLPFLPFDEERVLSSTGALSLKEVPKRMLLVGAGVIGLEMASVYRRLGSEVIAVEMMDRVCPVLDRDLSKGLLTHFHKEGVEIHLSSKVKSATRNPSSVTLEVEGSDQKTFSLEGDVVLVSIGRRAYSKGLGLKELGIESDNRGVVKVNTSFQTKYPSVYAIGDLIGEPMLAHKASEEGVAAVNAMNHLAGHVNYMAVPNVTYTWPEAACVGLTESEAKETGRAIRVGKCPFRANSRSRCSGDEEGLVKIVGDVQTDRLLGMHILGPNASEMILGGVFAIEKKMTVTEVASACYTHPTCSEAIKEAALACLGRALHM